MNSALWIAIAAAVVVVLAHIVLFWWFLCKGRKTDRGSGLQPPAAEANDDENGHGG
jgi:flagellar basal body-associated protein FliL